MPALTGGEPASDGGGRFIVSKVSAGPGLVIAFGKSGSLQPLANHSYSAVAGQRIDVGSIKIVPPRTTDAGTLGMATEVEAAALAVTSVSPGGPAALAGVVAGDKITAIDGHALADVTPKIAQTMLSSGTIGIGQTVSLALERGTTVSVTSVKW